MVLIDSIYVVIIIICLTGVYICRIFAVQEKQKRITIKNKRI